MRSIYSISLVTTHSIPAKPIVKELRIKILPGGHESDGHDEEADAEDEQEGADDDGPGLGGALEAAAVDDGHLDKFSVRLRLCKSRLYRFPRNRATLFQCFFTSGPFPTASGSLSGFKK